MLNWLCIRVCNCWIHPNNRIKIPESFHSICKRNTSYSPSNQFPPTVLRVPVIKPLYLLVIQSGHESDNVPPLNKHRASIVFFFILSLPVDSWGSFIYPHDDFIKRKHFPRYWTFGCEYNRHTGDLKGHRTHYDVIVMARIASKEPSELLWLNWFKSARNDAQLNTINCKFRVHDLWAELWKSL